MSRLTRKETNYLAGNGYRKCDYLLDGTPKVEALNKLGTLEDLEAELGIDLIILFKALKDGIYSRDYGHLLVEHFVLKSKQELHCRPTYRTELRFALKDYGKTWALSRNDLEEQDDE